jgi:hypothetical protein
MMTRTIGAPDAKLLYSCEIAKVNQEYIKKFIHKLIDADEEPCGFKDIAHMKNEMAACFVHDKEGCKTPSADNPAYLDAAGFSCKTMSKMCSTPLADKRKCLQEKTGSSGITFDGLLEIPRLTDIFPMRGIYA